MDMISPGMYIFVIFIAGIAGFIDAVAGGGGVITMPAYMFAGIPPHNAYAINKLAAVTGSVTAAVKYIRGGAVDIKVSVIAAAGSAVGGLISAGIVMLLSDKVLEILVFIAIPLVAVAIIFHKNNPDGEHALRKLTSGKVMMASGICAAGSRPRRPCARWPPCATVPPKASMPPPSRPLYLPLNWDFAAGCWRPFCSGPRGEAGDN